MGRRGNWFCAVKQVLASDCTHQRPTKSKKKWFVKKKKKIAHPVSNPPTATDNTSATIAPATTPVPLPPPPAIVAQEIKQQPAVPVVVEEDLKVKEEAEEIVKLKEEIEEEDEEQRKHAESIAIATAKAAEAAAAAAQAAAEVVRLTNAAPSPKKLKEEELKEDELKEEEAALRIQTAFRAYLARRALCALRGLASLNIMMQVKCVKPQSRNTLKSMQSLVRVQSQVRSKRLRTPDDSQVGTRLTLEKQVKELERVENLLQHGNDWNSSPKSKEQIQAQLQRQHGATMRRERALAYSLNNQKARKSSPTSKSANTMFREMKSGHSGWSWLERWLAARPWEAANGSDVAGPQEKQTSESSSPASSPKAGRVSAGRLSTSKARVSPLKPKRTSPRRSLCCEEEEDAKSTVSGQSGSSGEEETVPSYMAPTESARAKTGRLSVSSAKKMASSPARSRRSASSITDVNSGAEHHTHNLINAI